ncbi:hypothetical protein TthAA22_22180 (plasmid) [Thermus thermophilus]|uniref:Uncharacterized protein n=1 Tax=Thermus thermophilus TaxID=274 RepID=A0AAD1NZ33_THETH|nr:hypothetical protein TthAA11_21210 [Thermus thermophilus]BCZ90413.1 hypothetical protein TthAA22_22180 [Thermus thermophilus]
MKRDGKRRWQDLGTGRTPPEGFAWAGAFRKALARYRRTPEGILAIREGLEALGRG